MKNNNDLTFEPFVTFLATIPHDPELATLGETYAAAQEKCRTLQERTDADRAELAALDEALIDAPSDMGKLLKRRAELIQALDVWPGVLAEAQRRRALAHLYYFAAIRRLALAEATRANQAVAPHMETVMNIRKMLDHDDAYGSGNRKLDEARRATLAEQRAATFDQMRHDQQQLQRAQEVAQLAEVRAHMFYGEQIRLEIPSQWQDVIEQRARVLAPTVMRTLVHA